MAAKKDLKGEVASLSKALRQMREEIRGLDRQIDAKMDTRQRLRTAPPTRDEAINRIAAELDNVEREGRQDIHKAVSAVGVSGSGSSFTSKFEHFARLVGKTTKTQGTAPNVPVLLTLLREPLLRTMREIIDADPQFDDEHVLPADQREERIAALDTEIEDLEAQRQALVQQLRDAGFEVKEVDEVTA